MVTAVDTARRQATYADLLQVPDIQRAGENALPRYANQEAKALLEDLAHK